MPVRKWFWKGIEAKHIAPSMMAPILDRCILTAGGVSLSQGGPGSSNIGPNRIPQQMLGEAPAPKKATRVAEDYDESPRRCQGLV